MHFSLNALDKAPTSCSSARHRRAPSAHGTPHEVEIALMAKGEKHHKDGGGWSSIPAYNTKGAPSESTPCKIKNDTSGAGARTGSGGGHGASHIHGGHNMSHSNKPNFGHRSARRGY